jgi:hypothetical protein
VYTRTTSGLTRRSTTCCVSEKLRELSDPDQRDRVVDEDELFVHVKLMEDCDSPALENALETEQQARSTRFSSAKQISTGGGGGSSGQEAQNRKRRQPTASKVSLHPDRPNRLPTCRVDFPVLSRLRSQVCLSTQRLLLSDSGCADACEGLGRRFGVRPTHSACGERGVGARVSSAAGVLPRAR